MRIFLGGTCNGSNWRDELIPNLNIDYFNPVVENWTEECQSEEARQKEGSEIHLYVITNDMTGVFSIAEVVDDSNKCPEKVVFCVVPDGFTEGQIKSLRAVENIVIENGGAIVEFDCLAHYLNSFSKDKVK